MKAPFLKSVFIDSKRNSNEEESIDCDYDSDE